MYTSFLLLACVVGLGRTEVQKRSVPASHAKGSLGSLLLARSPVGARPSHHGRQRVARRVPRAAMQEEAMQEEAMQEEPKFDVKSMAGITAPLGFFDPVGFTEGKTEGKIRFYREVEIKHGRLGMLAALGILVGENYHPLFGRWDTDVPAYVMFQQTPLQTFWGLVVAAIAIPEVFSVFTFNNPAGGEPWSIRSDHTPGDLGFDPLNLKPTDPEEFKTMQTKELNNGRLGMLAAAGMLAQELVTDKKLF